MKTFFFVRIVVKKLVLAQKKYIFIISNKSKAEIQNVKLTNAIELLLRLHLKLNLTLTLQTLFSKIPYQYLKIV